jgi:hypothetical protein
VSSSLSSHQVDDVLYKTGAIFATSGNGQDRLKLQSAGVIILNYFRPVSDFYEENF